MNNQSNSMGAFVSLISAIVILLGFAVMPWFELGMISGTALDLLQLGQSGADMGVLLLVAAAGVIGLVAGGWGLAGGGRTASLLAAAGGALGLIYYVLLLITLNQPGNREIGQAMGSLGINVIGIGFWIALIGCIGLVAQILMPSQSS